MVYDGYSYSVLVVSSSEKMNEAIKSLLPSTTYHNVVFTNSIASAKRTALENNYDFVIINAPLPDDMGVKFSVDVCFDKNTVCMLLVKSEIYEEIYSKVVTHGVFVLPKPTTAVMIAQGIKWMTATKERLRKLEKKTVSIEKKMEEIRIINRAKWLLIEHLKMTEPDAHRYIEKQAMNQCITRREIAEQIIKTYG